MGSKRTWTGRRWRAAFLLAALALVLGPGWARAQDDVDETEDPTAGYGWKGTVESAWAGQGGGQNTETLSFTSAYQFGEGGSSLGLGVMGGTGRVEGIQEGQGTLTLSGTWGVDSFTPNLSLALERAAGGQAIRSADGGIGWDFSDTFSLDLTVGYGSQHHIAQTAKLLDLVPSTTTSLSADMLSHTESLGLSLNWQALKHLGVSAGFTRELDYTDEVQNLARTLSKPVNLKGWTNTGTFGSTLTLGDHWSLGVSANAGLQYSPGIGFFNARTGISNVTAGPSHSHFYGGGTDLSYTFDL